MLRLTSFCLILRWPSFTRSVCLLWFVAAVLLVQVLLALYTVLYPSGIDEPKQSINLFVAIAGAANQNKKLFLRRFEENKQIWEPPSPEPYSTNETQREAATRQLLPTPLHLQLHHIPALSARINVTTDPPLVWWPTFVLQHRTLWSWARSRTTLCRGAFEGYAGLFCVLHNAVLDGTRVQSASGRVGGELLDAPGVIDQPEQHEYLTLLRGLYRFEHNTCRSDELELAPISGGIAGELRVPVLRYDVDQRFYIVEHLKALDPGVDSTQDQLNDVRPTMFNRTAVLVVRNDYANLFQTTVDWYDVFIVARFLQLDPAFFDVIFLDAHPFTPLDNVWDTLWPSLRRIGDSSQFRVPVKYRSIILLQQGYSSLLNHYIGFPPIPLVENFRRFFLERHNLSSERKIGQTNICYTLKSVNQTRCHRANEYCAKPKILILFRRDYVAHARNPSGRITRKFANEEQLVSAARRTHAGSIVDPFVPTELSMREQLQRVSEADMLIGMHGAGLTLSLFLPPHAALIELFSTDNRQPNSHFRHIAMARGLVYNSWMSSEPSLDDLASGTTHVPEGVIQDTLTQSFTRMCGFIPSFT